MKKFITVLLALCIICTFMIGCKGEKTQNQQTDTGTASTEDTVKPMGPFPIVKDKITMKLMKPSDPANGSWDELELTKELEQKTNIHWEVITAVQGYEEKKNIALATGDLPDVFFNSLSSVEEDKYGPQGILIPLDDLIDKYAPNVKLQLEKYPDFKKTITSLDGKIYALGNICETATMGVYKLHINMKWLEKVGMQKPKTVDELYNVLKAFKEKDPNGNGKPDEIPFSEKGFGLLDGTLLGAYGEPCGGSNSLVNIKNGKVSFVPLSEGFKAYLDFLRKIYAEKLLDNDMFSQTMDELTAKLKNDMVGISSQGARGNWQDFEILEPMTSSLNSKQLATAMDKYSSGYYAITNVCKYPEAAIKWVDIFFRDIDNAVDGYCGIAMWIGRKGVDWDFANEEKTKYKWLFEPPEGENSWLYFIKNKGIGWGPGLITLMAVIEGDPYLEWVANGNKNFYYPYLANDMYFPSGVRFTDEENKKIAIIQNDLYTYINEFKAKIVAGEESLTNWNTYEKTLKDIGVDEYMKILQAAYDRFSSSK